MFTKKTLPQYPNIIFEGNNADISTISETDIDILNDNIKKLSSTGNEKDFDKAILIAKKMAVYYGAVGLIHYTNLLTYILKEDLRNGDPVEQSAFNIVSYLNLAKLIYSQDNATSKKLIEKYLPQENIKTSTYWDDKISAIATLAKIESLTNDAKNTAQKMLLLK